MIHRHPYKAVIPDPMQTLHKKLILHFVNDDQPYLCHRVRLNDITNAESCLSSKKQAKLNDVFEHYVCLVQQLRSENQPLEQKQQRERKLRLVVAALYCALFK
ncbi:hypothetical protein [Vibrio tritonius]|uniref:hypothetical protein n=1 Tax=Vibrio tritonius TaxID=1435069 RepID=UPI000838EB22|nr:hypothetical protein [Vibrio tritonius]